VAPSVVDRRPVSHFFVCFGFEGSKKKYEIQNIYTDFSKPFFKDIKQKKRSMKLLLCLVAVCLLQVGVNGASCRGGKRCPPEDVGSAGPRGRTGATGPEGPEGPEGPQGSPSRNETWLRAFIPFSNTITFNSFHDVEWSTIETSLPTDWTGSGSTFTFTGPLGAIYLVNYQMNIQASINNTIASQILVQLQTDTRMVDTTDTPLTGFPTTMFDVNQNLAPGLRSPVLQFSHSNTYLINTAEHTQFKIQYQTVTNVVVGSLPLTTNPVIGSLDIIYVGLN
jgi:hypothetical protein